MNQSKAKIGTIIVGVAVVGMIAFSLKDRLGNPGAPAATVGQDAKPIKRDIVLGNFGEQEPDRGVDDQASDQFAVPALSVGVIGSTPMRREVTRIEAIPFTESEIRRAYRKSNGRSCRIVIPGAPVIPPTGDTGRSSASTYGRVPAMTIGLKLDSAAASKLPRVVRSQVIKYFADHRLSIQPTLYLDNAGQMYFGTDCQSAFYEMDRSGLTVQAESMIDQAIERFRSLGVVGSGTDDVSTNARPGDFGRTLAMAFRYERIDPNASTSTVAATDVTEILLLHLPADTADRIKEGRRLEIEVYMTSDQRQTLHRVAANGRDLTSPLATIEADVRFNSTVLLGLYPADPVVSSIRYQSNGVISMDVLRRMVRGESASGKRDQTPMSVTEVLDRFGELSSRT